jgi:hypothetical protein
MIWEPANWTRMGTRILAGILGLSSVWIFTTELVRPTLPFFPNDAAAIKAAAAQQSAAKAAAWIGLIQGKLWIDYAMTIAPDLSRELAGKALIPSLEALDSTRFAAAKAAEFAPSDARAWLLLAGVNFRQLSQSTAGPLKMSYYTGPNELPLFPLRINIATASDAITDPEIQVLVGSEIRTIITRRPELKPLIIAAYRNALPPGRRLIENQVGELDAGLLASIRATNRAQ